MRKFKYIKISKTKKLRIIHNYSSGELYLVFLPGFMSDLEGEKPQAFKKYAKKKKIGFLALEYSGHGKSTGNFIEGNISKWSNDTKKIISKFTKRKKLIIIGSSMGAWIALNQFRYFKKRIVGFVGIGSAPEFLDRLMWKKFPKKIKKEIITKGISIIKHGDPKKKQRLYEYPITYQLIKDGRKNKVLSKKISSKINVTMFHGKKDEVVPTKFSKKILSVFSYAKKKLVIIKGGDHSLSQKSNLKKIISELNRLIN